MLATTKIPTIFADENSVQKQKSSQSRGLKPTNEISSTKKGLTSSSASGRRALINITNNVPVEKEAKIAKLSALKVTAYNEKTENLVLKPLHKDTRKASIPVQKIAMSDKLSRQAITNEKKFDHEEMLCSGLDQSSTDAFDRCMKFSSERKYRTNFTGNYSIKKTHKKE